MKSVLAILMACMMAVIGAQFSLAQKYQAGLITIDHVWARPTVGSVTNTSAYMKLYNAGDEADRLVAAKTKDAEDAMLHETRSEGDVTKMVHLENGIEIPPHGSVELMPLGMHVMLMGLRRALKDGDTVALTLVFEKHGEVAVEAKVGLGAVSDPASGPD